MDIEEKFDFIQQLLDEEGFFVEWEKKEDHYLVHEVTCPYIQVVDHHPEVCSLDHALISRLLDIPATKMNCMLNGDKRCSYRIPLKSEVKNHES